MAVVRPRRRLRRILIVIAILVGAVAVVYGWALASVQRSSSLRPSGTASSTPV